MKQLANNIFLTALLLLLSHIATAQTFTLQGRVADKDNNPIELASVAVVAQGKMTMTNLKGEYSITLYIKSPAENGYLLHVDAETGVEAKDGFWTEPLTATWTGWKFVKEW